MADLSAFPITRKWPPANPDVIQLYSYPTANGMKASIMLEETGLAYEPHRITLSDADVKSPEYLSLNPNNKIPSIIDPNGPDGTPLGLFESGAILIYLAEKAGMLIGETATQRAHTIQWLMFQAGGLAPTMGQLGFFTKFAGAQWEDKRPEQRVIAEAKRLMAVVEGVLEGRDWLTGDYSIADIATVPWLLAVKFLEAEEVLGWEDHKNIVAYTGRFQERPAVDRGRNIPPA